MKCGLSAAIKNKLKRNAPLAGMTKSQVWIASSAWQDGLIAMTKSKPLLLWWKTASPWIPAFTGMTRKPSMDCFSSEAIQGAGASIRRRRTQPVSSVQALL